jgi:hypothetical protein
MAPATARRLGLTDGGLIEIVARGPSLRAWIELADDAAPDTLGLDCDGLDLLGALPSESAVLRRIRFPHV